MTLFLVRRTLPGVRLDELAAAALRIRGEADRLTRSGRPVRYLRSTYVAADGSCACLFDADHTEDVQESNERAAVPYDSIDVAASISAETLHPHS